jgi:HlyD family secretion protein
MSPLLRTLGVALLLVAALLVGFVLGAGISAGVPPTSAPSSPTPSQRPTPRPTPTVDALQANAVVVPTRSAQLSVSVPGRVASILVVPDQQVRANQLLLRLDSSARQAAVNVAGAAVRRAEAAVRRAVAQLELLPDDAGPAELESAQADLRLAEAELAVAQSALAEAEVALRQTELRAPFAGTIVAIDISEGEQAAAGQPIITLADTSAWLIQTTDLTELQVVRVSVGDQATISIEALPGMELAGSVARIQARGTSDSAGVRFDVLVQLDEQRSELRWGMRATVRFRPAI